MNLERFNSLPIRAKSTLVRDSFNYQRREIRIKGYRKVTVSIGSVDGNRVYFKNQYNFCGFLVESETFTSLSKLKRSL